LVDRRDAITHRGRVSGGRDATCADAEESIEVVRSFLQHLDRVSIGCAQR